MTQYRNMYARLISYPCIYNLNIIHGDSTFGYLLLWMCISILFHQNRLVQTKFYVELRKRQLSQPNRFHGHSNQFEHPQKLPISAHSHTKDHGKSLNFVVVHVSMALSWYNLFIILVNMKMCLIRFEILIQFCSCLAWTFLRRKIYIEYHCFISAVSLPK